MSDKKPRSDAKLKNLPIGRQAEIAEIAHGRKLEDAVELLRREGLDVSKTGLSDFLSWWRMRQSALGSQIVELTFHLREVRRRLDHRNAAQERQAAQARAAIAILRNNALGETRLRDALKRVFGL